MENVYTFNLPGVVPGEEPLLTIQDLAHYCLTQFTANSQYDTWFLAGWSFGGILAYETAVQMARTGAQAEKVILIDTSLAALTEFEQGRRNEDQLRELFLRTAAGDISGDAADWELSFRVFKANASALLVYEPTPYNGMVVEIQAEESARHHSDLARKLPSSPERVIVLPGDHGSIMGTESGAALARAIDECLIK